MRITAKEYTITATTDEVWALIYSITSELTKSEFINTKDYSFENYYKNSKLSFDMLRSLCNVLDRYEWYEQIISDLSGVNNE